MIASCPIHKPCNAMFDFDASSLMGVWRSVSANVQCSAGIAVFLLFHYISIIYSPILSLKCCSVVSIVLRELQSGCSPICDIVTGSSINDIRSILYSLSLCSTFFSLLAPNNFPPILNDSMIFFGLNPRKSKLMPVCWF